MITLKYTPTSGGLSGISFSTTGDFAVSATTCGLALKPTQNCTIDVVFAPTATGLRTGQLIVKDSVKTSPQSADLMGTGTPGSGAEPTPAEKVYPATAVGTPSPPQALTLIDNDAHQQ
jgi:hypothetical protein